MRRASSTASCGRTRAAPRPLPPPRPRPLPLPPRPPRLPPPSAAAVRGRAGCREAVKLATMASNSAQSLAARILSTHCLWKAVTLVLADGDVGHEGGGLMKPNPGGVAAGGVVREVLLGVPAGREHSARALRREPEPRGDADSELPTAGSHPLPASSAGKSQGGEPR